MPTFNDENYIKASIDSIINQSFSNWELLIMDKSTDNTTKIISSYVSKYPDKIKSYQQQDTGQLNALLGLVPHITGNYVMLIHSDDFLVNNEIISVIIEDIVSSDADGLYSDLILINKEGIEIGRNKSFFSLKRLIVSGGGNCIPDHFFVKKEIFHKYIVPNYLIRNIPYYFSITDGEFDLPNLKYGINPWYSYRVYEENLALSGIGLFILISGQVRLLKDFFLQGFIISPFRLSFNKVFNKMINLTYQKMTNFTEKVIRIKKTSVKKALKQFKKVMNIKKQSISKQDIEGKEISVLYFENIISSIDDLLNWKENKSYEKEFIVFEKDIEGCPTFDGKDIRLFVSEYLDKNKNEIIDKIYSKEYDIILCENEKTEEKLKKLMDFFNFLTPVIVK